MASLTQEMGLREAAVDVGWKLVQDKSGSQPSGFSKPIPRKSCPSAQLRCRLFPGTGCPLVVHLTSGCPPAEQMLLHSLRLFPELPDRALLPAACPLFAHVLPMAARSYAGSACFRQRILLSTLSRTTVTISDIRMNDEDPGLSEAEVNLLSLVDKISNGSCSEVDETGTRVVYTPGVLIGGKVEHDCGLDRSIGYFLEVLVALAPFCKTPLHVTLRGVTNDASDPSVDAMKYTAIPVLKQFLKVHDENEVELKVVARGLRPKGGGIVLFRCPIRRVLKPMQWLESGKIKRIRGLAFACRVSPQTANRMVDAAKGILLSFLPDVFIHTEHMPGNKSGLSPGFGIVLFAETTKGVFYVGEAVSRADNSNGEVSVPEDVARQAAHNLFEEIFRGGCTDSTVQGLTFLFMALGETDLSKAVVGPLTPYSVHLLRHMQDFLKVTFKLDAVKGESRIGSDKVTATCVGIGFSNLSKTVS